MCNGDLSSMELWYDAWESFMFDHKGLGKELHYAACCGGYLNEPSISNAVRRIMCAVRDEVMSAAVATNISSLNKHDEEEEELSANTNMVSSQTQYRHSLTSMLYAHPQYLTKTTNLNTPKSRLRSDSLSSDHGMNTPQQQQLQLTATNNGIEYDNLPKPFHEKQINLKSSIMEVIQEIKSDLEDTQKNINDQAVNQIFTGEVIFTYGRSFTVESVSYIFLFFWSTRFFHVIYSHYIIIIHSFYKQQQQKKIVPFI